ncbi:MAG: CoB--CoM heterodisulfide reductase iron-sulfur subunit B family protein [Peptococcaceae bacterium]|nr:CoB--CoM heterodisulfide reductase iron-sulfur subunit B family protein [Peptococcaceae bacterium]
MRYSLYPGCSMEGTAVPYLKSLEAVAEALDMHLEEIPDWNCCGATVASGVVGDYTQQVVAARNLALAEPKGLDVLVGCSSCYLTLANTNKRFKEDKHFKEMANEALAAGGLKYNGRLRVRQVLEVFANDAGLDKIRARIKRPLTGLKVAGYVGCQTVRAMPWEFDDPENPVFLDRLIEALGATAVPFPMKARCCGSSQTVPAQEVVLSYGKKILDSAAAGGAQLIITPCPMCQLNLEAYQPQINKAYRTSFSLPVLFFTQLMAVAFDLPPAAAGLKYCMISPLQVLSPYGAK